MKLIEKRWFWWFILSFLVAPTPSVLGCSIGGLKFTPGFLLLLVVLLLGFFRGIDFNPIAILLGLPGIFWITQLLFIVLFLITFVPLKTILQKYSSSSWFPWFVIVSSYFIYYAILIYIGTFINAVCSGIVVQVIEKFL